MQLSEPSGHVLTIVSLIGVGAYGSVFKAMRARPSVSTDTSSSCGQAAPSMAVAVKEVVFDSVQDEPGDLLQEVSLLSSIFHPCVVQFYCGFFSDGVGRGGPAHHQRVRALQQPLPSPVSRDVDDEAKRASGPTGSADSAPVAGALVTLSTLPCLYLVQEYVHGGSVAELVAALRSKTGPGNSNGVILEEEQVVCILIDVLEALRYLHDSCRVLHRDVKSANILLSRTDGYCKLCDFGASARKETVGDQRSTMIGTPGWMAPELWQGSAHHSVSADIWALGATVLEMTLRVTPATDPLFSQYVKALSLMPCSFRHSVTDASTFDRTTISSFHTAATHGGSVKPKYSALDELSHNSRLLDFVACCLRRDPEKRPRAVDLLNHPLLLAYGFSTSSPRKIAVVRSLADAILTSRAAGENGSSAVASAIGHAGNAQSGTGQQQQQHIPKLSLLFLHRYDKLSGGQGSSCTALDIVTPPHLATMCTSEAFRNLSSLSAAPTLPPPAASRSGRGEGTSTVGRGVIGAAGSSAAEQPLPTSPATVFNDVIAPASIESRLMLQRVFGVYRSLALAKGRDFAGQPRHSDAGTTAEDEFPFYPLAALEGSCVDPCRHEALMDKLLRAFHRVEHLPEEVDELRCRESVARQRKPDPSNKCARSLRSFSLRFCEWLSSLLLTNAEDGELLMKHVEYFEALEQNPFRTQFRGVAARPSAQGTSVTAGATPQHADPSTSSGPVASTSSSHGTEVPQQSLDDAHRRHSTASSVGRAASQSATQLQQRSASASQHPLPSPCVSASEMLQRVPLVPTAASGGAARSTERLLDPAAALYNRWVVDAKQKLWNV